MPKSDRQTTIYRKGRKLRELRPALPSRSADATQDASDCTSTPAVDLDDASASNMQYSFPYSSTCTLQQVIAPGNGQNWYCVEDSDVAGKPFRMTWYPDGRSFEDFLEAEVDKREKESTFAQKCVTDGCRVIIAANYRDFLV